MHREMGLAPFRQAKINQHLVPTTKSYLYDTNILMVDMDFKSHMLDEGYATVYATIGSLTERFSCETWQYTTILVS